MKIINLKQSSPEWLKWRREGVGASEISILMGTNMYSTPQQLWEKKCGFRPEEYVNRAMQFGIDNEDKARNWINTRFNLDLKPVCIEDDKHSHYKASLDGYDEAKDMLHEIKCPSTQKTLDDALKGVVHDYWIDQVIWQAGLSNIKNPYISIWDYRTQDCITIPVIFDENRFDKMKLEADKFWQQVKIGSPPSPQKGDFIDIDDPDLERVLYEYQQETLKKKEIETKIKYLKSLVEKHGDDGSFRCNGFKIVRMMPPSSYDISKMREDGIEVDLYRKKSNSIGYYRIFPPKNQ